MQTKISKFGHLSNGEDVTEYTLMNENGVEVSAITYGATWRRFVMKDQNGIPRDLILKFNRLSDYEMNPFHLGNTIGRVGGRIANAAFSLNGREYRLEPNEGDHLLHGGARGMDTYNWNGRVTVENHSGMITFKRRIDDDGFPGTLESTVTYILTEDNELTILFTGISDRDTLFNPMTHVYFNLADGQNSILGHVLQIRSVQHLAVNGEKLPTGELLDNEGTAFDFSRPQIIQKQLEKLQGADHFDDAFVLTDDKDRPAIILTDPDSRRRVVINSDRNAAVIFTANPFAAGGEFNGLAVEMQTLPDAIHHEGFGDITLPARQLKKYEVSYRLETGES